MPEYTQPQSFDFGAATGQGFNLPGGKSYLIRVAAWAALLVLIIYAALGVPIVKAYVSMFMNMEINFSGETSGPENVAAMMAPMVKAAGFMMLIGLLQMVVFAAAETAIYRNLFHHEDRGLFPLMFGMDELRVVGTRLVVGFILGGIYMGAYVVVFLIGALMFGVFETGALAAIGGILIFAAFVAAIAAFVWIAIRLAPASAYAVKHRRFNPFASWEPMKGLVWPAIGSYLILYVVGYFILSFVMMIILVVFFLSSGLIGVLMEMDGTGEAMPDFSPLMEQVTSAGFIIPLLIAIFLGLFLSLIWYGAIWSMWGYLAKDKPEGYWQPDNLPPEDVPQ